MIEAKIIFWACLFLIAYAHFLYPILLFQVYVLAQTARDWRFLSGRANRRAHNLTAEELPSVSMVIPAFNEAAYLVDKIANLRALDYPAGKLEVIFVSDGSTDETNAILTADEKSEWRLILLPERGGKSNALNQAVLQARHEILIFSDASTLFSPEALRKLVRHFSDPKTGVVCGSLQFRGTTGVHADGRNLLEIRRHAPTHGGSRGRDVDGEWGDLRSSSGMLPDDRVRYAHRGFCDSHERAGSAGYKGSLTIRKSRPLSSPPQQSRESLLAGFDWLLAVSGLWARSSASGWTP